jgi:hypothetical protein
MQSQNALIKYDSARPIELENPNQLDVTEVNYDFSFFNTTDSFYNVELLSNWYKHFSSSVNMELEETPFYENGLNMLRDFMYLNINLNYNIGKIGFSFSVNNILNFLNSEFSIEPELYGNNDIIKDFYFTHDQSFSIQTVITYSF